MQRQAFLFLNIIHGKDGIGVNVSPETYPLANNSACRVIYVRLDSDKIEYWKHHTCWKPRKPSCQRGYYISNSLASATYVEPRQLCLESYKQLVTKGIDCLEFLGVDQIG